MSGTPRHGRNARIMADITVAGTGSASRITSKNKWTIDQAVDFVEVTATEDFNKSYVAGFPDAKGTISGFWDSADSNVYNIIGSSVPRAFYLYPDAVNNITSYFWGTCFFSVNTSGGTAEAVGFNINFQAAGFMTWTHP